jgi:A/G-specific adenine glycosylase
MIPTILSKKLLIWYNKSGRKALPWRKNINPYRVWLSEIMLQQTQVNTVLPYFKRFLTVFPSIKHLAQAELDEVLHLWAGLGYYSRARNLYRTANIIHHDFNGKFPSEIAKLIALPGIGRSTAGAIRAIAFNQPAPILDGNVKRILTRLHAIEGHPGEKAVENKLWQLAENYLPKTNVADYTQALMDLGATVCTLKKPQCMKCPFEKFCLAHANNNETAYPTKKKKSALPTKQIQMLMLFNQDGDILLEQRPPIGIWGGLWSLPECTLDTDIDQWCENNYGFTVETLNVETNIKHTFTHFHLIITPIKLKVLSCNNKIMQDKSIIWYNQNIKKSFGLATPVSKLLRKHLCHE